MYDELIKRLRELQAITEHCDEQSCDECENRELCDKHDNKTLSGTYKEAADAIEELSKPRWIPVTERLPSVGNKVIVAIRDESGDTRYDYTNTGWYSGNGYKWVVEDEYCSWVTHWMPLPQPPKEE